MSTIFLDTCNRYNLQEVTTQEFKANILLKSTSPSYQAILYCTYNELIFFYSRPAHSRSIGYLICQSVRIFFYFL